MSRDAARRALHNALVELDRTGEAATAEAIMWVVRAHFALLDLKGMAPSCPGYSPAEGDRPAGMRGVREAK